MNIVKIKYPEQLEFCKNRKLIYLDHKGRIYYQGKLIIQSDIIRFNYIKIDNQNLNIFDQIFFQIVDFWNILENYTRIISILADQKDMIQDI